MSSSGTITGDASTNRRDLSFNLLGKAARKDAVSVVLDVVVD